MPEPRPQKQAREEAEGTSPTGHAEETKATKDETEETMRTERAAKAPRDNGGRTRNTTAEGQAERTNESAPRAHPTATEAPEPDTARTTPTTVGEKEEEREREPQKPTKDIERPLRKTTWESFSPKEDKNQAKNWGKPLGGTDF